MGLLSGLFGGNKSSSSNATNNYDQRQVNDASGGGIAGNRGTINITDASAKFLPAISDGLKLGADAQRQALDLAKAALSAGRGDKTAQTALIVVGIGLALLAFRSR